MLIPQDVDYPALQLDVDREKAAQLGLSQKEVVDNVITALTSNGMIAPNYWVDPKSGNPYLLTVQYPEETVNTMTDLRQIPLRGPKPHTTYVPGFRGDNASHLRADGSGSLPIGAGDGRVCGAEERGSGNDHQARSRRSFARRNSPKAFA